MSRTSSSSRSGLGLLAALALAACGETVGPPTTTINPGPCRAPTAGTVAAGQTRSGNLSASDCILLDHAYADGWRLDLAAPTGVRIDLMSGEFDAFLLITDPHLDPVGLDDDGGEGLDSRFEDVLPAGSYIVWASSFGRGETGSYRLSAREVRMPPCAAEEGLSPGRTVRGTLEAPDCRLEDGFFADPWRLSLAEATSVQLDLRSPEFDTFLIVARASGTRIASDDDSGGDLNSRLLLELGAGEYVVWASSYAPGATGSYELSARPASAAATHAAGAGVHPVRSGTAGPSDPEWSDKTGLDRQAGATEPPPGRPAKW